MRDEDNRVSEGDKILRLFKVGISNKCAVCEVFFDREDEEIQFASKED